MLEELQKRAQQAVELGQAAGAQGVWATANRGRSVEFEYRDGNLEKVQESTSRGLGIQLYVDGRYSTANTTDLRPEALKSFISDAVELTRALQPDPHRQLPDPALFEGRSEADLDLVDRGLTELTQDERIAWCAEMDELIRADERVISTTAGVFDGHNLSAAVSSNGFSGSQESTSIWMGTEVSLQDPDGGRPEASNWIGGRHKDQLRSPQEVAEEALRRAVARLGTQKGPTRTGTLVVDPRSGGRILGQLLRAANARSIQQGRSFWAGRLGQSLFSERLTLIDDPLLPRGLGSRTYDGEGLASRRLPLIEAGVVKNVFVDTYYGRKAEMPPTTGGSSNLLLEGGSGDLDHWLAEVGEGVLLTSWLGGNSDTTTGDFSYGMRGHPIVGGELGPAIGEMNLTGNLVELFSKLVGVGDDPWAYSRSRTPTLVFEDVQFSGA
jgi:PmbA protein